LGHTSADFETAAKAFAKGATSITHFFNAMTPFGHRSPNLVGAGLLYPFYLQFIGDGVHTHEATIKIMCQYVKDRLVLITDATMAAGLGKPGVYKLGNRNIIVDETSARLEDGTLAGSVLTMDRGFRNLVNIGKLTLGEAFTCASLLPAKSAGIKDRGSIKKGFMADLVVLSKDTLQVEMTIGEGKVIYARSDSNL
jgi:N-acetylglucosamine-6-phosphate deacetylase